VQHPYEAGSNFGGNVLGWGHVGLTAMHLASQGYSRVGWHASLGRPLFISSCCGIPQHLHQLSTTLLPVASGYSSANSAQHRHIGHVTGFVTGTLPYAVVKSGCVCLLGPPGWELVWVYSCTQAGLQLSCRLRLWCCR